MKKKGTSHSVKIFVGTLSALLLAFTATAQLVEFPITSQASASSKQSRTARTNTTPLNLPFWDDFSLADSVKADLWQYGRSVFLNNGLGINPPSRNVVTFDGVDSLGKPYNVNDVLAKGLADKLVSQPIRMDLVDPGLYNTVFFSFYYQVKGLGENPDNGDMLILSFLNKDNKWESIYTIENSDALAVDVFYQILIPITDSRFYHSKFQFRIQNFARLSGPYDTWNVDYVYLNTGRSVSDNSYPDRTVSSALNSLFADYYAMPIRHFMQNPTANLKKPALNLYNLRAGNQQPFDYSTEVNITTYKGNQTSNAKIPLDVAQDPGTILTGLQFLNLTLNSIPPTTAFDPLADSIKVRFKYGMSTKDNVLPSENGDYDPAKYSPIDFRFNDSTRSNYVLSSYYAYDDGSAEYGAGLNQAGAFLAFKFLMKSPQPDTLAYVAIYFPEFGDNTNQSLQLQIRSNLSDDASSILFEQLIQVIRKTKNKFAIYHLEQPVIVKESFYICWRQASNASIPVGLDKNNDHGDKMYFNTNGTWTQNVTVKGSMMMRPGFGKGKGNGEVTGIEPGN